MVDQFLKFKERTEGGIQKAEQRNKAVTMLENLICLKSPCMEAEYAIDDRTSLSLYDCLLPKLKEHRRFRIQKDAVFSVSDFKAQLKIKQYDSQLEQKRLPLLLKTNAE